MTTPLSQKQLDQLIALMALGEFDQVNASLLPSWPWGWLQLAQYILLQAPITVKVSLLDADGAAGLLSWENTSGAPVIVSILLDVTTPATGAHTADFGQAATAVSSPNLIDELDLGAAAGIFSSQDDPGVGGRSYRRVEAGEFVTGSTASGAASGLVGTAFISYQFA